jgi:nitroreductase
MDALTAIRSRRTIKAFTGAALPRSQVEELVAAACWAPNHRLAQPWRFRLLDQPAIARLGDFLKATPAIAAVPDPHKGAAKLAKLLDRLGSLGALVMVGWERAADPSIDLEDHAAAAAAVQNLCLAATAAGLGSFWSTNPALSHPLTLGWCGLDPARQGLLGAIWLGTPAESPEPPPRKAVTAVAGWV